MEEFDSWEEFVEWSPLLDEMSGGSASSIELAQFIDAAVNCGFRQGHA